MILLTVALAITATLIALSPRFSPRLYRGFVFKPQPYDEGDYASRVVAGIQARDVSIRTGKGDDLHGWFFEYPGASSAALFCHGNAGNVASWSSAAAHALRNQMSALIFDYRGFGKSPGTPTLQAICRDGLSAFDFLRDSLGFEDTKIVLIGISLGSGVASHIASKRDHAGLLLQAGYSSFPVLARQVVRLARFVPGFLQFRPVLDNARVLSRLNTPKLIIHGGKDELIDISHAHALYQSAAEPKRLVILRDSTHGGVASRKECRMLTGAVDEFLLGL